MSFNTVNYISFITQHIGIVRGLHTDKDIQSTITGESEWGRRAMVGIDATLSKLSEISSGSENKREVMDELHGILTSRSKSPRVNLKSTSQASIEELAKLSESRDRIERLKEDQSLSVFGEKCTPIFWELVKGDSSVVMGTAGETDEVVTVDTKRVIRWVGSLHGKSGLKVTEFPIERLDPEGSDSFDPLSEAVVFRGDQVKVRILAQEVIAEILGTRIETSQGEELVVDESMAMFLCLKGWAELCD